MHLYIQFAWLTFTLYIINAAPFFYKLYFLLTGSDRFRTDFVQEDPAASCCQQGAWHCPQQETGRPDQGFHQMEPAGRADLAR